MQPVGLGNIRILVDYAQKSPWTLDPPLCFVGLPPWLCEYNG